MVQFLTFPSCCDESSKNIIILYTILAAFAQLSLQFPALSRRAALEAGHVSFPNKPHDARSSSTSTVSPSSQNLKITSTVIPAISSLTKVHTVKPLTIAVTTTVATSHVRKEWIPGHVRDHAYIPAHARNVFLPAHPPVLATVVVPSSTLSYRQYYEDDRYRSHYGGFGVGVDYGGQGAGHGYQVAL